MKKTLIIFAISIFMMMPAGAELALGSNPAADVQINDLKEGEGVAAVRHSRISVHYTGWLADGTKFDSSHDRNAPFEFLLGGGQVIPGWDIGIEGMKAGGVRELVIPPDLAYGPQGAGDTIPANATLKFKVELISLSLPGYTNIDNAELKKLLDRNVKIVDLRRPDEWKQTGVVKDSKLLTAFDGTGRFVQSFPADFTDFVTPDEEVILICRTGNRSSVLANMLVEQANYMKVYNVTDGIVDWIKAGNPVSR